MFREDSQYELMALFKLLHQGCKITEAAATSGTANLSKTLCILLIFVHFFPKLKDKNRELIL